MEVARAEPWHAPTLAALLAKEMWPEIGYGTIDLDKVVENICACIATGAVFVTVENGEMTGSLGIRESEGWWWSRDTYLSEQWVFVRPKFRKSRAAFLLLKAATGFAKERGKLLVFGISSPLDMSRKEKLFGRFGRKAGCFYVSEA